MKALVRDRYGPADCLVVRDLPTPVPGPGQVRVRVHATALNDWDAAMLEPPPLMRLLAPWIPVLGCDVAGRVDAVGEGVTRFRPGDDVYGDLSGFEKRAFGGFAEYVCASETQLAAKPAGMSDVQAAAIPQAGMLALQGLAAAGSLERGQDVLINGAGGGVGTFGIQLAKAAGARVTGVDRGDKLAMLRSLGYDYVLDYTTDDFTRAGRRYDLIVDTKTNRSPLAYVRALKPHGTYATVGGANGRLLQVVLFGRLIGRMTGTHIRLIALKPNRDLLHLNERFTAGQFTPVIDRTYPLRAAPDAFRRFAAGDHQGKIVITVAD